jgi:hypothetical protein
MLSPAYLLNTGTFAVLDGNKKPYTNTTQDYCNSNGYVCYMFQPSLGSSSVMSMQNPDKGRYNRNLRGTFFYNHYF